MTAKFSKLYKRILFLKANLKKAKWQYPTEVKSIWIIRLGLFGDLLMISPFPKLIKEKYPNAEITIVVKKQFADIWKYNPYISKIIEIQNNDDIAELQKIIKIATKEKVDMLISLDCSRCGALLGACCPAKWSIGIENKKIKNSVWNFSFKSQGFVRMELYKSIANTIGLDTVKWKQEIFWRDQDEKISLELLKTLKGKLKIGFIPWTSKVRKDWLLTEVIKFYDFISAKEYSLIILGAPSDRQKADLFLEKVKSKPLDLVGKTSMLELAALIKHLDIIVTCDTATAHLAAIFNKPTIVLYGPTSEGIWKPDSQNIIALSGERCNECIPLIKYYGQISRCPQKSFKCMNIKAEEVMKALELIITDFDLERNMSIPFSRSYTSPPLLTQMNNEH